MGKQNFGILSQTMLLTILFEMLCNIWFSFTNEIVLCLTFCLNICYRILLTEIFLFESVQYTLNNYICMFISTNSQMSAFSC